MKCVLQESDWAFPLNWIPHRLVERAEQVAKKVTACLQVCGFFICELLTLYVNMYKPKQDPNILASKKKNAPRQSINLDI